MAKCKEVRGCSEEATEASGLCLVHEKVWRGSAWREAMADLKAEGFEPPLCDADECDKLACVEGYDWVGYCAEHEPLPPFVTLTAMLLGINADAARAGLEEDAATVGLTDAQRNAMSVTTARLLISEIMSQVQRIREEEQKRAKPAGGHVLGQQRSE